MFARLNFRQDEDLMLKALAPVLYLSLVLWAALAPVQAPVDSLGADPRLISTVLAPSPIEGNLRHLTDYIGGRARAPARASDGSRSGGGRSRARFSSGSVAARGLALRRRVRDC